MREFNTASFSFGLARSKTWLEGLRLGVAAGLPISATRLSEGERICTIGRILPTKDKERLPPELTGVLLQCSWEAITGWKTI